MKQNQRQTRTSPEHNFCWCSVKVSTIISILNYLYIWQKYKMKLLQINKRDLLTDYLHKMYINISCHSISYVSIRFLMLCLWSKLCNKTHNARKYDDCE